MVYQLVCEGGCNPGIGHVNILIREFTVAKYHQRVPYDGTNRMLLAQSALKHTDHTLLPDGASASCDGCGHVRQYGNRTIGGAQWLS